MASADMACKRCAPVREFLIPRQRPRRRLLAGLLRLLTGGCFIFSGFVKAVDPWGTLYKMQDYLDAMGLDVARSVVLVGVFVLFSAEFLAGVFLLIGCFRRMAVAWALAMMAFFVPLTLWLWVASPVKDCGCFGDALVISNGATFWKNIILTLLLVWLWPLNKSLRCFIAPPIQWLAFCVSAGYVVWLGVVGYTYQPLLDFRPYKIGSRLWSASMDDSSGPEMVFVYEKDGVRREIGLDDDLPEEADGWSYVGREMKDTPEKVADDAPALPVWEVEGGSEPDEAALSEGKTLLLMVPDLDEVSTASSWAINSIYQWASARGISMAAVTAGSDEALDTWEDIFMPEYPVYGSDDTDIKEAVRGNPAMIYLEDGVIKWKSTLGALDATSYDYGELPDDPMTFSRDNVRMLWELSGIYGAVMAFLMALSLVPAMRDMLSAHLRRRRVSRDDRAHLG